MPTHDSPRCLKKSGSNRERQHQTSQALAQEASVRILVSGFSDEPAGAPSAQPTPVPASVGEDGKRAALRRAQESDRQLNAVYNVLRNRLNREGKRMLTRFQKEWLQARTAATGSEELLAQGMSADNSALRRFADMNETRIAILQNMIARFDEQ